MTIEYLGSDLAVSPIGLIPQLTDVVKGPGGSSSAIFQLRQGSVIAGFGEIGSNQSQTLSVGGLL